MLIMSNNIAAIFILSRKISITHRVLSLWSHTRVRSRSLEHSRVSRTNIVNRRPYAVVGKPTNRTPDYYYIAMYRSTHTHTHTDTFHTQTNTSASSAASITLLHCTGAYLFSLRALRIMILMRWADIFFFFLPSFRRRLFPFDKILTHFPCFSASDRPSNSPNVNETNFPDFHSPSPIVFMVRHSPFRHIGNAKVHNRNRQMNDESRRSSNRNENVLHKNYKFDFCFSSNE